MGRLLKSRAFWEGFATAICSPFAVFRIPPFPAFPPVEANCHRWTDVGSGGVKRG